MPPKASPKKTTVKRNGASDSIRLANPRCIAAYTIDLCLLEDVAKSDVFFVRETIGLESADSTAKSTTMKLHAGADISIFGVSASRAGTPVASSISIGATDKLLETVEIRGVTPDVTELTLWFSNRFRPDERGLYRSTYDVESPGGGTPTKKALLSTHHEPISARQFFVCHDEPAGRADTKINITLADCAANQGMTLLTGGPQEGTDTTVAMDVVSNMLSPPPHARTASASKSNSTTPKTSPKKPMAAGKKKSISAGSTASAQADSADGALAAAFARATAEGITQARCAKFGAVPKVPPYLVACFIGHTVCVEETVPSKAHGCIPVRFFAAAGRDVSKMQFCFTAMKQALALFEDYFGAPYPLPKLDMAAVPAFPIGGQENWGLILVYEGTLIDPDTAALSLKSYMYNLVAHEVSHMWFGNLVGVSWWEGLWLKEGFASFFGYVATQDARPAWAPMDDAASTMYSALGSDSSAATHAVEVTIANPKEIASIFDDISYNKGMALVRMLHDDVLGPEAFRAALRQYIARFSFRNATTDELWAALADASGVDVAGVMSSFTQLQGFPQVTCDAPDLAAGTVRLTQRLYRYRCNKDLHPTGGGPIWSVPVRLVAMRLHDGSAAAEQRSIMSAADDTIKLEPAFVAALRTPGRIACVLNPAHSGFYVTQYPAATRRELFAAFRQLPEALRLGLVVDTIANAEAAPIAIDAEDVSLGPVNESFDGPPSLEKSKFGAAAKGASWQALAAVLDGEQAPAVLMQYATEVGRLMALALRGGSAMDGDSGLKVGPLQATAAAALFRPLVNAAVRLGPGLGMKPVAGRPADPGSDADAKAAAAEDPKDAQLRAACWRSAIRLLEAVVDPVAKHRTTLGAADDSPLSFATEGAAAAVTDALAVELPPSTPQLEQACAGHYGDIVDFVRRCIAVASTPVSMEAGAAIAGASSACAVGGPAAALALLRRPDMQPVCAMVAARFGPTTVMDGLSAALAASPDDLASIRARLGPGIASTRSAARFDFVAARIFNPDVSGPLDRSGPGRPAPPMVSVRASNSLFFMTHMRSNGSLRRRLWPAVRANIDNIIKVWGAGQFRMASLVSSAAASMPRSEAAAAEFEAFFEKHPVENAKRAVACGAESMRLGSAMKDVSW